MKNMIPLKLSALAGILTVLAAILAVYAHVPVPTSFGALAGPDIPFPYLRWGGVMTVNGSQSPTATTTSGIFCAIQSPAATSSVEFLSWRPDNSAMGSGQTFDISTSSSAFASSSPAFVVAANLQNATVWTQEASSTGANVLQVLTPRNATGNGSLFTVAPNTYITWDVATSAAGTFATYLTGNCQAQFITL